MPSKGSPQAQIFKQDTEASKLSETQHEMSLYEANHNAAVRELSCPSSLT